MSNTEDRENLIHKIVFKAELGKWDEVEKYKKLYRELFGEFNIEDPKDSLQTIPPHMIIAKGEFKKQADALRRYRP